MTANEYHDLYSSSRYLLRPSINHALGIPQKRPLPCLSDSVP